MIYVKAIRIDRRSRMKLAQCGDGDATALRLA
jgi:hypothetical protein